MMASDFFQNTLLMYLHYLFLIDVKSTYLVKICNFYINVSVQCTLYTY